MGRVKIFPSILAADFAYLADDIKQVEKAGADGIHLDVMDGHFVPNITFGPVVVRSIRKTTSLPFWAHLMITDPGNYIEPFRDAGVQGIFVHIELDYDIQDIARQILDNRMEAGIVINPTTSISKIDEALSYFERILVMTVQPGFGGQSFMSEQIEKIRFIKKTTESWSRKPLIEVDGGIDINTVKNVVEAGVDIVVAGSAIFHQPNPGKALKMLRKSIDSVSIKA